MEFKRVKFACSNYWVSGDFFIVQREHLAGNRKFDYSAYKAVTRSVNRLPMTINNHRIHREGHPFATLSEAKTACERKSNSNGG